MEKREIARRVAGFLENRAAEYDDGAAQRSYYLSWAEAAHDLSTGKYVEEGDGLPFVVARGLYNENPELSVAFNDAWGREIAAIGSFVYFTSEKMKHRLSEHDSSPTGQ